MSYAPVCLKKASSEGRAGVSWNAISLSALSCETDVFVMSTRWEMLG